MHETFDSGRDSTMAGRPGIPAARAGIRLKRPFAIATLALAVALLALIMQDAITALFFPRLTRVTTDFSAAYLQRELARMASERGDTVFLGDSVLWGYRIRASDSAVAVLATRGCACRNLSFKGSSPPNYYALSRLMLDAGVRPAAVVLEVNQKVLNDANDAYQKLHPALQQLALPSFAPEDRALLTPPPKSSPLATLGDRTLSAIWLPYAMRADIRETLSGDTVAAPIRELTPDLFEGDYDLSALDENNVGVHFLEKTVELLRANGVRVVAFFSPPNHALLHDYIDNKEYRDRAAYLRAALEKRGASVTDFDADFHAADYIDESHLTPPAQIRLADLLSNAIGFHPKQQLSD